MHSSEMTLWMFVKHILGIHTYGEIRYFELCGRPMEFVEYQNCEICGNEKVFKYHDYSEEIK